MERIIIIYMIRSVNVVLTSNASINFFSPSSPILLPVYIIYYLYYIYIITSFVIVFILFIILLLFFIYIYP